MSVIASMCLFALSMSVSPGPVNLITLSAGVSCGFRRTLPFVTGATVGFSLLLLLIGLGLDSVAAEVPFLLAPLGYGGAAFIAFMGYKLAVSKADLETHKQSAPSFYQGFALQWLNPKAWIACLSGVSAFQLSGSYPKLMLFVGLYFAICFAAIASWALLGQRLSTLMAQPRKLRLFNAAMGGVLMLVACNLLIMQWLAR